MSPPLEMLDAITNPQSQYLLPLNSAQRKACVSTADSIQILAGPGSGKTRVLTTRVTHLIRHHKISPFVIIVVTFTNKAANEMRSRLSMPALLGEQVVQQVLIGTFHSVCAFFLRRHGSNIGIQKGFGIADTAQSKSILQKLAKELGIEGKPDNYLSEISRLKSRNISPEIFSRQSRGTANKQDVAILYKAYEENLKESNYLDFDSLLTCAVKLFKENPSILNFVEYVLVDEFQDTNAIQYELLKSLTQKVGRLTVVGDPDQSIFSWRNADTTNFNKMLSDFPNTDIIHLEQNYRSTPTILRCATHVIEKDKMRIPKLLTTQHPSVANPSLLEFSLANEESEFIANEIKRLIKYMRGLLSMRDFAILLRNHALSRAIEEALMAAKLSYRVVGAHKFFDRTEIKDVLSYVRLLHNVADTVSFSRVINIPRRGVGEVSLDKILCAALKLKRSPLEILENVVIQRKVVEGVKLNLGTREKVMSFLKVMSTLRKMIEKRESLETIISTLLSYIKYEEHLKGSYQDWQSRSENIQELLSYAARFSENHEKDGTSGKDGNEGLETNIIANFLEATTLSSDVSDEAANGNAEEKVTIATLHISKGLEWPCVFIIGCEDGVIPHSRSRGKDIELNEESRLLYVGMTRAKCFLYCTYVKKRLLNGQMQEAPISPFLRDLPAIYYSGCKPTFNASMRASVARILGKPIPSEETPIIDEEIVIESAVKREKLLTQETAQALNARFGGFNSASMVLKASSTTAVPTTLATTKSKLPQNSFVSSKALVKEGPMAQSSSLETAKMPSRNSCLEHAPNDNMIEKRKFPSENEDIRTLWTKESSLKISSHVSTSKPSKPKTKRIKKERPSADIRSFFGVQPPSTMGGLSSHLNNDTTASETKLPKISSFVHPSSVPGTRHAQ